MTEEYLGDGLYASFDGFMFTLRAPRDDGDHWIGLEPEVLRVFDEYRNRAIRDEQEAINRLLEMRKHQESLETWLAAMKKENENNNA